MKTYPRNSPEAMARVIAMAMITDAKLDDRELEIMDHLYLYEVLGLSRTEFSEVVRQYCDDLVGSPGAVPGRVDLMDRDRIDAVIDAIDDPQKRLQTAQMIANVAKADGHLHDAELALFRHVLERWDLSLDQLKAVVRPAAA
ncbi:MAG: TerB family tellurite resistance protein [Betaproteobacteria bacterium]